MLQLVMQTSEAKASGLRRLTGSRVIIFSTLAAGWKSSASRKGHSSRWAKLAPTVLLPEPETPMRITALGSVSDI